MDVQTVAKRLSECINSSNMRQNAQFDLAIVQTDQSFSMGRNKGFANASAIFGADRNVL